jgi:hypothetical protein
MKITKTELKEMIREALREELVKCTNKFITESFATKEFEIPGFDFYVADQFEDENVKGYNIVYIRDGMELVEVEVWETNSPVTVNNNLYSPNLMQKYYTSFEAFAEDLEYKYTRYIKK